MQTPFQMFSLCCLHNSWSLIRIQTRSRHVVCELSRFSCVPGRVECTPTVPNPVQHFCWPILKSERPSSDELQNLELYLRMWIVQAVLPRARAGMPEQMARRDLRFQSPIPNLLHGFIHWLIWGPSCSCFSFIRPINNGILQSCGSPAWAGIGLSWPSPTAASGEFNSFPSEDGALVGAAFVSFGSWFQMASSDLVLYLQEALHALRYLKMVPYTSAHKIE